MVGLKREGTWRYPFLYFVRLISAIGEFNVFLSQDIELTWDNIRNQPYYWGRVAVSCKSWWFRMFTLTDSDLEDKVPKNNLKIHSIYCDKSNWSRGDGLMNFWNAINEGHSDMTWDFFGW